MEFIRRCLTSGYIRWTYHVAMRLRERALDARLLIKAVDSLELVESYPDDKYLPSYLVRGDVAGVVFHAQIATDIRGNNVRVVTMYVPRPDEWDNGYRTRRNPR